MPSEYEIEIEPMFWIFRLVESLEEELPDFYGVILGAKLDEDTIRLTGAMGPWDAHMYDLALILKDLGFTKVAMMRHKKERVYDLDHLMRKLPH